MRRNRALSLAVGLLVASAGLAAGRAAPPDDGPWMVRAYGWTQEDLAALRERFDHVGVYPEKGMLLLYAATPADWERLVEAGLRVEIDRERTAVLRRVALQGALGLPLDTIPGFECYRTVEEMLARGAALATEYPQLATWSDIGDSWEKIHLPPAGYDMRVLTLTNSAVGGDKPASMITGSTHAREYVTAEFVTRLAERLLALYGVDPDVTWLLDYNEIHLVLVVNPDGRKRAETGLLWRKNADNDFCTGSDSRGIDLNRNFDFMWGNTVCQGSSSSECAETFHGPSAASEPETQAIQARMDAIFPDQRPDDQTTPAPLDSEGIFIDVHAFGEQVLTSWGCVGTIGPPPNEQGILTLARKIAFFPGYTPLLGSTGPVDGSTKDYTYGRLGVPGYTVEMGTSFFESCSYFEEDILKPNLEGFTETAKHARASYLTPSGPDAVDTAAPALPVAIGSPATVTATLDDTRFAGAEPSQAAQAAELYVDTPPWDGGSPVAMAAVDGSFDETVEEVTGVVSTGALAEGRHTVFVRGRDVGPPEPGGTWGAVSAAFLYLVDAGTSPTVEGTVTDATTGLPLTATVDVGPFELSADPSYSLQVPVGSYSVTAMAPGYAPRTADAVLSSGQTVPLDFSLQPLVVLFSDDVESGNQGWSAQAPWAITTEAANSPTHSWTDSPGGNYGNDADTSLTSQVFDLTGLEGATLSFRHIYDFEQSFDRGLVEISTDGATWTAVRTFSLPSQTALWALEVIPVPQLDGAATARFRFRLTSDGGVTRDGWHVDDIVFEAAPSGPIFADGFESGDTSAWSSTVE